MNIFETINITRADCANMFDFAVDVVKVNVYDGEEIIAASNISIFDAMRRVKDVNANDHIEGDCAWTPKIRAHVDADCDGDSKWKIAAYRTPATYFNSVVGTFANVANNTNTTLEKIDQDIEPDNFAFLHQ